MDEKELQRRRMEGLMPVIITMDAGGPIDAGAMVVTEEHFEDYKAPVPRHFDKMVVRQFKRIELENYEACIEKIWEETNG